MPEIAIRLENVSKFYKLYDSKRDRLKEALDPRRRKRHREFYALRGVDLEVRKGEILGVVGRNGAGKSTLLKLVAGVIPPSGGRVEVRGRVSALLDLSAGMNPNLDGIRNILFGGIMLGFTMEEMRRKLEGIVAFADIGEFIRQPLRTYSSGMRARLGFALAVNVEPEILVVDEVLAVGDELFRRKCYAKMESLMSAGCTVVYVSHAINTVNELCSRAILIEGGRIILDDEPKRVTIGYEKILYGSPEQREEIRLSVQGPPRTSEAASPSSPSNGPDAGEASPLFDSPQPEDLDSEPSNRPCLHVSYFLDRFQSKTRVLHRMELIDLVDIHLETAAGERVNVLFPNDSYLLRFNVRFDADASNVAFACTFKTEKGRLMSGVRFPPRGRTLDRATARSRYSFQLKFRCALQAGTYYVDCGVLGFADGRKRVLSAIYDALVFKVQSCRCLNEEFSSWGPVSLEPDVVVGLVSDPAAEGTSRA